MRRFALLLLWLSLVVGGYYYAHKPLDVPQAAALARIALQTGGAAALLCVSGGLGAHLFRSEHLSGPENALVQAAAGMGVMAAAWLLVGLAGLFRPAVAWGMLIAGLLLFRHDLLPWGQQWRVTFPAGRLPRLLVSALTLFVLLHLGYALAPPVRWDALMYHLDIPRRYLLAGRFLFLPQNPYWGQPQLGALLYTWAMALAGGPSAAVLGWGAAAMLSLALWSAARRLFGGLPALAALTALLLGATWRGLFSWAYVDVFAALYGGAVSVLLLGWLRSGEPRLLRWGAVCAGLALDAKLTAGALLLPLAAAPLLFSASPGWRRLKTAAQAVAASLLVFAPWMLLSAAFTGSPLYPQVWDTPWVDALRRAYFSYQAQGGYPLWHWLGLPLSATWFGLEGAGVPGTPTWGADLGPWLVALALAGLALSPKRREARFLGLFLLAWWGGSALGALYSPLLAQPRLFFALFPAVALLAAAGWQAVEATRLPQARLGRVAAALLLLSLGLALWSEGRTFAVLNPLAAITGSEPQTAYLQRALGTYAPAMQALEALPADSRVLFLWEPRGLYAPASAEPDYWIDRWYLLRRAGLTPAEILHRWRSQGYTHVLLNRAGAQFEFDTRPQLTAADRAALRALLGALTPTADLGDYRLYALPPGDRAP